MELNQKADFGSGDKVVEIQQSIHRLLAKLEQQDHLQWPEMLDSYMVISAQFSSLMKILRVGNRDDILLPRNVTFMPVKLSPDLDPVLQRITEGRIPVWSHAVVPDYLRTKADRDGELFEKQLMDKAPKTSSADQLNKSAGDMAKRVESIITMLNNEITRSEDEGRPKGPSYSNEDTRTLVRMITSGKGLEPQSAPQQTPHPPAPKTSQLLQNTGGSSMDMMSAGSPAPGKFPNTTPRAPMRPGPYMRPGQPM